jgi:TP901 family phage tail tape measure protein
MATDIRKQIELVFNATNRTGGVITAVGKDLGTLNSSIGSLAAPFASITKGVLALDTVLVGLAVGGVTASVSSFKSFDDVMRKVGSIMGASQVEMQTLTQLTKDLGATTRYTAQEAAQGLEFLAMAGFSASESMEALPQVLNLAQASATDLGSTADILTNIMAGYGIKVEDLAGTTDVLTAAFTNSNTNLVELGAAFKYVGPVANAMGLSIEETSAILGKLADAGYKADQGGTALRNILLALAAPAGNMGKLMKELGVDTEELGVDLADSANALRSLGVEVKDAQGNLKPFPQIMDDLAAGLSQIQSPADRAATLVEIFGKRGGPQMAALLSQGSASVGDLKTKIESLGGVTTKIAGDMEAGIGGAVRALISAFQGASIEIGEKFSSGLIDPIGSLTDIFRTLRIEVADGTFDPVFDAFDRFGESLAGVMGDIAETLPEALERVDWSGIIDSLENLKETFGGVFDDLDFDDPDDLADAIQGVVDTFESLVDFTDGIADVFVEVGGFVLDLIEDFNNLDSETKKTFGSISGIGSVISGLTGPFAQVADGIKAMGTAMQVVAGTQVAKLATSLVGAGGLTSALGAVVSSPLFLGVAAGAAGGLIGTAFRKAIPAIDDAAQSVLGWIDKHTGVFGVYEKQQKVKAEWEAIQKKTVEAGGAVDVVAEKSKEDFLSIVNAMDPAMESTKVLTEKLREMGVLVEEPKDIKVTADTDDAKEKLQEITYWIEEGGKKVEKTILVPVDTSQIDKAKEKIETIPLEKQLEIETDLKIEQIKASAAIAQDALKFRAEVDIAEIQAASEMLMNMSDNITEMFTSTGDVISSLFDTLAKDTLSMSDKWAIQDQLREEAEIRQRTLKMQEKLNDAQIAYLKERTKMMQKGEALIQVDGTGLAPELEMIMYKLFAAIQVRASQEGLEQLLLGV